MAPPLPHRRTFLRGVGATLGAATFTHLVAPRWAAASDLSLSDRIDLLYSNQFHFNQRGEPQVTVGLLHGRDRIRLSAAEGLVVLPSGDGGTRIEGGQSFEITVDRATPADQSYAVVLEELAGPQALKPGPPIEAWKRRGFDPHDEEVGTVFGVAGHVLDNRRVRITTGKFSSEIQAMQEAARLVRDHGALGKLHPIVHRRAKGSLVASDPQHGIRVRAEGVLWFASRGDSPVRVHAVGDGHAPEGREREYWGSVYVAIDRFGKLSVVNLVSEMELLAGLVPAEIYASAPMAALQAQAVAARGQLVTKVGTRHLDDPYLLCADQHCQVYAGRGHEHPRTTKAVRETAGWVAMRPGKRQLVDTVYSANCGGHTEDNEEVWPGAPDPQLRGRADPLIAAEYGHGIQEASLHAWLREVPRAYSRPAEGAPLDPYRWTATIDKAAISGAEGVPRSIGGIRTLQVLRRGRSGRATALRIGGATQSVEIHGELRIREVLGGLRSSMFVVEGEDRYGRFVVRGGGHGHGVGMCQHGAMGMARAGQGYREILRHYYRDAELVELW